MKKNIQDSIISLIKNSLRDLNLDKVYSQDLYLDLPKDNRFGDLSTNIALRLSSLTKRPALQIAIDIVASINKDLKNTPLKDYIKEIKVENAGFINFYLDNNYFYEQLKAIIIRGENSLKTDFGKKKSVLVEFASANPTGPLSVAHARQAAVGDVLANILDYLGFKVKREYYLNDEGKQIDILGESVGLRLKELSGERIEFPQDHYQGEYIWDIAKAVQEKKLRNKDFSEFAVKYILEIIKKELADFGVRFDYWYSQKKLRKSGKVKKVLNLLKRKGFIYEEDGASWLKTTLFSDDKDRVVVKNNGAYTYLAPDIAYHQDKFKRGFNWLINLWGPDHHGYINRLKAAIGALGKNPDSLSIIIVQLVSIFRDGKSQEMSTRKGQYITLREVLDEVGPDAARFFFLMRRASSHLVFDLEMAKKQTPENPVYYVQYAHARICSILRNGPGKIKFKNADITLLKEKQELGLLKKLWQFSCVLNICLHTLDPYMLTVYLQELAESFHKFYDAHRVLGEDLRLTQARLALIEATRVVIAGGLELLAISSPQKM
ncbi:MAG: arginine--tRNA ligase [Candidatus Omnitrophica bacterium]|nr:arginine--tRNA ligase [Candidatus Omnitrophota bacterium]MBU4473024.1 arginine--tRNA ligase [Candidatus Omnitrophota bacterium]MCG2706342.1 arginine--tRNA ligase [Candidatus Omnitrophota bacterium]